MSYIIYTLVKTDITINYFFTKSEKGNDERLQRLVVVVVVVVVV